jgi:branched-chain amino acid transport system substrate-binding protein
MRHKSFALWCLPAALALIGGQVFGGQGACAQDAVKVGVVVPMTGTSAAVGREIEAGTRLYMAQHGDTVAGKKIQLIIRDDALILTRRTI